MSDKLNYQQAKRIREQSLSSVLADQLILGEGYGSGLAKSISLKTRARITGIKQKFDPLNIAKFLTGGSRLGPAIVGKMLGRSRKDIEFFAGRARPVTSRNQKIGALPGGEDTTGMTSVLEDILTFLHRSHEDDMVLREKENNLREGEKHEDDRRHKDLLKALGVKPQAQTATPVAQKSEGGGIGGLFDSIIQAIKDMIAESLKVFDWLKDVKFPLLRFLGSGLFRLFSGFFAMAGPLALGALLAYGAKELVESVGQKQIDTSKDLLERNKKRDSLSQEDRKKLDKEIQDFGGMKKINQVMDTANGVPVTEREVPPRPDTTGGKNKQRAINWDIKFGDKRPGGATHNPDGTPIAITLNKTSTVQTTPNDNSVNDAEMKKLQRQNDVTKPVLKLSSAESIPLVPTSSAVSAKTNENMKLNIQAVNTTPANSTITNKNVVNKTQTQQRKIAMPSVRNMEETFQRTIYNSTRVV